MPIYEYRCPSCGHEFEQMVRLSDPIPPCPSCGASEVRKLISQTSFVLKGGGWYSDHYGLKSSSSEKKSDGGSEAKPSAPATTPAAPATPAASSSSSGSSGTSGSSGSSGSGS